MIIYKTSINEREDKRMLLTANAQVKIIIIRIIE